ncbi:D-alanyl-D-alanine carboxypeptidase, serine-type, PBP4 family [Saccharomonospora azurea NA-128]|uniref:D-alanyl-D-alanine carboxypeptidase, serine-type, PBP4 family n=1 Tax=Saccharomonospora azurea NA-128 TaxID=882081 RepID=H8G5Q3_9PSEU|nr:D-alanyl-D-alanine carboxypeptidase, serine-type, PBP4 family [Saccharomonospora azurea NA-128]
MPDAGDNSGPRWPSADHDPEDAPDKSDSSSQQTTVRVSIPTNAGGESASPTTGENGGESTSTPDDHSWPEADEPADERPSQPAQSTQPEQSAQSEPVTPVGQRQQRSSPEQAQQANHSQQTQRVPYSQEWQSQHPHSGGASHVSRASHAPPSQSSQSSQPSQPQRRYESPPRPPQHPVEQSPAPQQPVERQSPGPDAWPHRSPAPPRPQPSAVPPAGRQAWPQRIGPDGTGEQQAVPSGGPTHGGPAHGAPAAHGRQRPQGVEGHHGPARPLGAPDTGTQAVVPADAHASEPATPTDPPDHESSAAGDGGRPRRRRLLVAVSVGVVLLLAAGVTLALPPVSNRLGLPWAPNAPLADPPEPRDVRLALSGASASGAAPTPQGVAAAIDGLASDSDLGELHGSVVDPATGQVLWERGADTPATPASTTKVLVSAAALLALDHDMRLPTRVVEGAEPGTVVLVGGGDVTLSSLPPGEESIFPGAAHLDDLVAQVKEATGGAVERVELDLSAYTGPETGAGWAPDDVPSTFMVKVQPAMLDGGRTDPKNKASMGQSDPAGNLAEEFAERLGAEVGGETKAPENATVLGEVWSAPVDELVRHTLVESDNLLGEVLARQVAAAEDREGSFDGGAAATLDVLRRHGVDVSDVVLHDGSGLSPRNSVPASTLTQVIQLAAADDDGGVKQLDEVTAKLRPLLIGMPVAGGSGTLAPRYDEEASESGRGWVRAKTGTLSGVHTLAGVVLTEDDRVLAFALMSDGKDQNKARAALDRIAAALRGCGCR